MELKSYLAILWRRKWVIVITTIVTVLATVFGVSKIPPVYEASTTLRIAPAGSTYTDFTYASQLKDTFIRIATSDMMLNELSEEFDLDEPPSITAESLGSSQLMLLTAEYSDPEMAQKIANTAAGILTDLHDELYVQAETTALEVINEQLVWAEEELAEARMEFERISAEYPEDTGMIQGAASELELKRQAYSNIWERNSEAQVREMLQADAFSILEAADLPDEPSGFFASELYVAVAGVIGLAAGVGLAFLFENLDSTLHTSRQIQAVTQLPVLGKIPTTRRKRTILFSSQKYMPEQEEVFRRLRTNLFALGFSKSLQTLLVTSAEPKEGKTTIVANLAYIMSKSGKKVVAVDCDMRRPTLNTIFKIDGEIGLSNVLQKQISVDEALISTEFPGLFLICAGEPTLRPAELLDSQAMDDLIYDLKTRFDIVLLDSPAIMPVTDAAILAPGADRVLLVVGRARVGEGAVRGACQQLADVGMEPIGVVVNREKGEVTYGYYGDYRRVDAILERKQLAQKESVPHSDVGNKSEISQPGNVSQEDPLNQIMGIGPTYEKALNALGIFTFEQLGEQDVEQLAARMKAYVSGNRIRYWQWIEQAKKLNGREKRG